MIDVRFRPLQWQGVSTPARERRSRATFKAPWSNTLELLDRELRHLDASDIVIEADFREGDIRLDGWPKASARVGDNPGVRIAFSSPHGPLVYATDSCVEWQHNVRSIGLGLEALRAVDRYGITHRGEQYAGWRQIESGAAAPMFSRDDAWIFLLDLVDPDGNRPRETEQNRTYVVNRARRLAHPDLGGSAEQWIRVQAAIKAIEGGGR